MPFAMSNCVTTFPDNMQYSPICPPLLKKTILAVLLLIGTVFLQACAGAKYGATKAPPPTSVTIAVRQFTTLNYAKLPQSDKGVRDFEQFYLPAEIVSSFGSLRNVSAFCSIESSPATDFVVDGSIIKSDGKQLAVKVTMHRVDGAKVCSKVFTIDNKDARERVLIPKMRQYYSGIASYLTSQALKTTINLDEARAMAYAENPRLKLHKQVLDDARVAGQIERESIHQPLTASILPRARIASKVYLEWQVLTIPLQKDRELARYEQNLAIAGSAMGVVYGAASLGTSVAGQAIGNQQAMQQGQEGLMTAQTIIAGTGAARRVAANREQAIIRALVAYKNQFTTGIPRQVTIRIYNKIITLHGSQAQMSREFKQFVKQQLNASSTGT